MIPNRTFFCMLLLIFASPLLESTSGQSLLFQVLPNGSAPQDNVEEGQSVATGEFYHVTGKPLADYGGGFDSGAVEVYTAATSTHLMTIPNPDGFDDDEFGHAVAVSGEIVVVGTPRDDTTSLNSGRVYVFDLQSVDPTTPTLILENPSPANNDRFGCSVAIDENYVVVGANQDDTGDNNAGSIYVYDLTSMTPATPVHSISHPRTGSLRASDFFGSKVSISGDIVVTGVAAYDDPSVGDYVGAVYVFDISLSDPSMPVYSIPNPSPASFDQFGISVSISGTLIAVGASEDDQGGEGSGTVYLYDLETVDPTQPALQLFSPQVNGIGLSVSLSGSWLIAGSDSGDATLFDLASAMPTQPTVITDPVDPNSFSEFGRTVSIFAGLFIVGDEEEADRIENGGAVYVFDATAVDPNVALATLFHADPASDDQFGKAVDQSGDLFVVGAPGTDAFPPLIANTGSVYLFDQSLPNPNTPVMIVTEPDNLAGGRFGFSVCLNMNYLAVGAPGVNINASDDGSVYIYDLNSSSPDIPFATLRNPNPTTRGEFGITVALSGDLLAVGATENDEFGTVYIFDMTATDPTTPILTIPNPAPVVGGRFGYSTAFEGSRLVVGAPENISGGEPYGAVYVFDLAGVQPTVPVLVIDPPVNQFSVFGAKMAISGDRLIVGAIADSTLALFAGAAHVYDLASATPTIPEFTIPNPTPAVLERFGDAVMIEGDKCLIGVPFAELIDNGNVFSQAGEVHLYDLGSETPTVPNQTIVSPNSSPYDYFGSSVSFNESSLIIGAVSDDTRATFAGSAYVYASGSVTLIPDSLVVTRGVLRSGSVAELAKSDNVDTSISRNVTDVSAVVELEIKTTSPTVAPTSLSVRLESSVFARGSIQQTIELFNFEQSAYEAVDVRPASRFGDQVTSVDILGAVARFVDSTTGCMQARVRYDTANRRQQFTANLDQWIWSVD